MKTPTGDYHAQGISYQRTDPVVRSVELSTQPGEGSWGMILQMQTFQRIFKNTDIYATGFYLVNPRKKNGTEMVVPRYPDGVICINGVPDQ